jgi:hypothetical protein
MPAAALADESKEVIKLPPPPYVVCPGNGATVVLVESGDAKAKNPSVFGVGQAVVRSGKSHGPVALENCELVKKEL